MKNNNHISYMPGLDGLRAIAVIAIIAFHLNASWLPGGFLGVDTFFIISGFLITTILLNEYRTTGTIDFKQFWWKRIKRLFPAVFFMLIIVFNYCLFFEPKMIHQLKQDSLAAFLYLSNWWYIFDHVDYFHSFDPRPLQHLWSLAIEEQFYLFFPIVLFIMLSLRSKKLIFIFFLLLALCSSFWMSMLYHPGVQITRLYFGTDTRLQTILLGVMLAFLWPVHRLKRNSSPVVNIVVSLAGVISIALLFYSFFHFSESSSSLYQGGFFTLGIVTLIIIASSVHPNSLLKHILSMPLLTMIGRYSYSLYLWHYPIIVLINNYFKKDHVPSYIYIVEVGLTIVTALFSYHVIETPFRREGIKYFTRFSVTRTTTVTAILLIIGFTSYQWLTFQPPKDTTIHITTTMGTAPHPKQLPQIQIDDTYIVKTNTALAPLFIGDSVLVDINDVLKQQYPNATIDGEVGRSIYKAIPVAKNYSLFNQPGRTVVLGIGTNGDFESTQLNQILSLFDKADVYLVTAKVPLSYENHVNMLMKQAAKERKNVHIIDWYAASEGHPEYFAPDGIHLEPAGVKAMNRLFSETLPH